MNFIVDEPLYDILMVLADLFIKGLLILLGARILTSMLSRSAAAARHLIWATALIMILMLPLFSAVLPRVSVPLIPQPFEAQLAAENNNFAFPEAGISPSDADAPVRAATPPNTTGQRATERLAITPESGTTSFYAPTATEDANAVLGPIINYVKEAHWSTLILGVWGLGIGAVLLWTLMGLVGAWWITIHSRAPEGDAWDDLVEELADRLLIYRPVSLKMSASVSSPMTWGAWRPVILLPVDADDWSEERRRYVLLHEMAHIKRWDTLTLFGAQLGCALHWFNPMAWQGLQRMRIEQEKACDDLVLSQGMKASAYASHLLDIARSLKMSWVSPLNTISMAKPSQLEGRVVDILDPARKRRTLNRVGTVLTCILATAVMLPITALSPWQLADTNSTPLITQSTASGFAFLNNNHADEKTDNRFTIEGTLKEDRGRALRDSRSLRIDRRTAAADTSDEQRRARKVAINALRKSLSDENAEVRRHAVQTLSEMNDAGAINMIAELAMRDSDTEVRRFAIMALCELDADEAIDVYIKALADRDREVRQYAAIALADVDDERAVNALVRVLDDRDPEIRRYALMGIVEHGDKETTAILVEMLNDSDPEVRRHALYGLADREEMSALPAIGKALRDKDADVRRSAVLALHEYDDDESLRLLQLAVKDKDPDVRSHAIMAISDRADDESMPLFTELLQYDKDPEIRKYAAIALGEIGDVAAVEPLTKALKDSNSEVRRYATMALSELDYGDDHWEDEEHWEDEDHWEDDEDWDDDSDWDDDEDWDDDDDWEASDWDGAAFGEAMAEIGVSAGQIGLAVGELSLNLTAEVLEEVAYSLESIEFDGDALAELENELTLSERELEEALIELENLQYELEHEWSDADFESLLDLMDVVGPVLTVNPELCEKAASLFEDQSKKRRKRAMKKLECSTSRNWDN